MERKLSLFKKIFFNFLLLSFFYNLNSQTVNIKSQGTNDRQDALNFKYAENYSKADWTGQGIFRNYQPEDEIVEKRTRSSKHFRNTDGTITAVIAAGSSLNYEENGLWQSITRELEPNNSSEYPQYPYANTHNSFKSFYPAGGGSEGILTILKEGNINDWINPKMYFMVNGEKSHEQSINSANVRVNHNEIIYKNIYNNIDIEFIQNNDSRKMNIIINNSNALSSAPSNATDLVFEETIKLPDKWMIREENGCINIYSENNSWIARYEKPIFFDSGKERDNKVSGNYNILTSGNNIRVEMFIPVHWLKQQYRKYPVIFDPSVSIYPAGTIFYTGTVTRDTAQNFTKNDDSLFHVCNTPYNPSNTFTMGFMKFDLSSISSATSISSGTINYYCYANQSTSSQSVMFWELGIDPVTSSANAIFSNNTAINGSWSWSCAACWYNWSLPASELTNILNKKVVPGWTAYKMVNGNSSKCYNFYGYSNSIYKPYLTINYCSTPGTPTNLSATVTGTTTATLSCSPGTPAGSAQVRYYWEVYTTGGIYISGNNTTTTNTTVAGLTVGSSYYFRVQAGTSCDNTLSAWDTSQNFITLLVSCTTPGTPLSLSSYVINQTTVALQWLPGTTAGSPTVSYLWEIYTTGGVLTLNGSTSGTSAIVSNLSCGTAYFFRVRANTSCDTTFSLWAFGTNFVMIACTCVTPGTPVNLSSTVTGTSSATLSWSAGTPAGSQVISFYWEIYTTGGAYATGGNSSSSPVSASGLNCGTSYYFSVRAYTSCDSTYSSWAASSNFTTSILIPTAPSSITSNLNNICSGTGGNIILSSSGGSGNVFAWYSNSCGTDLAGTNTSININIPTNTTIYYARWENTCGLSPCLSIIVNIIMNSSPASNAIPDDTTICPGEIDSLRAIGGLLSQGANWFWYTGTCGGTYTGSGSILAISPTTSDNYYVRAEGPCYTTSCISITINLSPLPVAPFWATTDRNNFCSNLGGNITLTASGGSGTIIMWYKNSCGGTLVGSGNPKIIPAPAQSTIYYALWQSTGCNNSTCVSRTVTILLSPTAPASLSTSVNNLCTNTGGTIVISGSGGVGNAFGWYTGSCGGTLIGTGKNLNIPAPGVTTTYWGRQQTSSCGNSPCKTLTVIVNTLSTSADSISVTGSIICGGNSVSLSISGGTLSPDANWNWYSGSCAGAFIMSGSLIIQSPSNTTTYYSNAEGICNTTSCVSKTVIVINLSSQPSQISGNTNPQAGQSEQYTVVNDSNATSYFWSYPTGWTGTSMTNSIICVVGTNLGTISVIPSNTCGSGPSRTLIVDGGFTINGNFYYNNSTNPLDSIWVFLRQNGNIIDSVRSDINGYYEFDGISDGAYNINATTTKPWGGVNATDAVKVKRHFAGAELLTSSIRLHAADVNISYSINSTDAVKITRRFVGSDTSFIRGDWLFEKPLGGDTINVSVYMHDTVIVNGSNVTQNFDGICVGDVNASNIPPLKSEPKITIDLHDIIRLNSDEYFELPIFATDDLNVGAISIILKFPKELVSICNVQCTMCNVQCSMDNVQCSMDNVQCSMDNVQCSTDNEGNNLIYNIKGDELRVGWYENEEALHLTKGEPVIIISGKTAVNFKDGDLIKFSISNDPLSEFADEKGNPVNDLILSTWTIEHSAGHNPEIKENELNNVMFIFPNPAGNSVNVRYQIVNRGNLTISLFNIFGEKVVDLVNKYSLEGYYELQTELSKFPPGIYTCRMILDGKITAIKRLVISK